MISDTLSEAVTELCRYLRDPVYENTYQGQDRRDLEALVRQMDAMRKRLDAPPIQDSSMYTAASLSALAAIDRDVIGRVARDWRDPLA